jgi:hypothetical protein
VSKPKRRRTGLPPAPSCANVPASHAGTIGNRKAGLAAAAMSPDGTFRTCRAARWCPFIEVKRTSQLRAPKSDFDPLRTLDRLDLR